MTIKTAIARALLVLLLVMPIVWLAAWVLFAMFSTGTGWIAIGVIALAGALGWAVENSVED